MSEDRSSLVLPEAEFVVVSGGQTGVDQAALDAAQQCGLPVCGWCPAGRRSEDGTISADYPLQETPSSNYRVRTEWNVRDSDGTLIVALGEVSGGTGLTIRLARQYQRPLQVVRLLQSGKRDTANGKLPDDVVAWIRDHRIRVLNVAGPRGSSDERVYPMAHTFCAAVFGQLAGREATGLAS